MRLSQDSLDAAHKIEQLFLERLLPSERIQLSEIVQHVIDKGDVQNDFLRTKEILLEQPKSFG